MHKLKVYFFTFLGLLVLGTWLFNLTEEFVHNRFGSAKDDLKLVDLANLTVAEIRPYISQGYGGTFFADISSGYLNHWHNGIDIAAVYGAPVLSPVSGKVFMTGNQDIYCRGKGYGKFIVVKDAGDGYALLYAHLSKIEVSAGASVKAGDEIGLVGNTGYVTATHLHLSAFKSDSLYVTDKNGCGPDPSGTDLNPLNYLDDIRNS